ncbi:hypothetical protein KR026_001298 [Drosophila bipectinata]|nr:hypothetical protein KR026_001298 [Drosophila bipectinata]
MSPENTPPKRKNSVGLTYAVTIGLLILGQLQALVAVEIDSLKVLRSSRHYFGLGAFFISFISIQLYGFFYHILAKKPWYVRFLAGLWTFEASTLAIMKPVRKPTYLSFFISVFLTYLMLGIGWIYGSISATKRRGCFMSRLRVVLWSERIFALTCFGVIVCAEMKRSGIEITSMLVYTLISNTFVVIFAASMKRQHFFRENIDSDYIFIAQLYYLNLFALCMSYVWALDCFSFSFLNVMYWL